MQNTEFIKNAIEVLEKYDLLKSLHKTTIVNDEPNPFSYTASLNLKSDYLAKFSRYLPLVNVESGGISFHSAEEAIAKCLGEFIERFCLFYYEKDKVFLNPGKIQLIDLKKYGIKDQDIKLNLVKGLSLVNKKSYAVPSQLIYLRGFKDDSLKLSSTISSGAAGGFSQEESIIRGIYEVVERDAFMTAYLTKAGVININPGTIKNTMIRSVFKKLNRYHLEANILKISNHINIPVYLCVLIDHTGIGPTITIGTKANFNSDMAILGAIEEAYASRLWLRDNILKRKTNFFKMNSEKISTRLQRALFWASPLMIDELNFFLKMPKRKYIHENLKSGINELKTVKSIVEKNGFDIYYVNIMHDIFKDLNYYVVKVIIPGMQALYLKESEKELCWDAKRLEKVSNYFGQKKLEINPIPHPML